MKPILPPLIAFCCLSRFFFYFLVSPYSWGSSVVLDDVMRCERYGTVWYGGGGHGRREARSAEEWKATQTTSTEKEGRSERCCRAVIDVGRQGAISWNQTDHYEYKLSGNRTDRAAFPKSPSPPPGPHGDVSCGDGQIEEMDSTCGVEWWGCERQCLGFR